MSGLDKIDQRILETCRLTPVANVDWRNASAVADLGRRAHQAPAARRFHRAMRAARSAAVGLGLLCSSRLLDKTTPDCLDRFATAVRRAPEVLSATGGGRLRLLIKTRLPIWRRIAGSSARRCSACRRARDRTYAVMEEVKRDAPLPLR